jgi:hypothetical protein
MFRDDLAPAKLSKYPCDPIGRAPHRLFKTSLWRANNLAPPMGFGFRVSGLTPEAETHGFRVSPTPCETHGWG